MTAGSLLVDVERWERAGGTWEVVPAAGGAVDVVLRRCDGGEEVERRRCADPAVIARLRERDGESG